MEREAKMSRKTAETDISLSLKLDGSGKYNINTGVGFFDHMLCLMTKHGLMDIDIAAKGDLNVDSHHTVEDVGIVLGKCFKEALCDKNGIKRYGTFFVPMDEALGFVSIDISGRPFLVFEGDFTQDSVGSFDTELCEEFFRAFAFNAEITLHAKVLYGKNNHHMLEALFKALGHAIHEAVLIDNSIKGVMSTKGSI